MIRNTSNGKIICSKELAAKSFLQRLTGLLTRKFSDALDGIVFENCNAIHTFGMTFDIDVIFFDKDNKIIKVCSGVKPWKVVSCGVKKCSVIELPAGKTALSECKIADIIEFQ